MIIHKTVTKINLNKIKNTINVEEIYLCNQAVKPTMNKLTNDWNKVTCKNCLKQKKE